MEPYIGLTSHDMNWVGTYSTDGPFAQDKSNKGQPLGD
jgi:hypothetical protein